MAIFVLFVDDIRFPKNVSNMTNDAKHLISMDQIGKENRRTETCAHLHRGL